MRRKYDIRNKKNFVIILILSIIIIGIFSLFIYKYKHTEKIEYNVKTGSVVQDSSKNFVNIEEDALLKVRWNGNYYLVYQDNKISLGKKVIVYDTITGDIKLYGKFYEIQSDGKIIENNNETVLTNSGNVKFYKLDDREYLLVDKQITSNDESINASGYLLVELDRMGNAKLSNYNLNLKTINPTVLRTSLYSFDIANEILRFNNLEIDLKKIIGSSNQYKEEKKDQDKENDNENGNGGAGNGDIATNNEVIANGTGNNATGVNNTSQGEQVTIEEIRRDTKTTSIIRTAEDMNKIDIDYVVYDPYNEYKTVYAEISRADSSGVSQIRTIDMPKIDTHLTFSDLQPDTKYNIEFYYTTVDKDTNEENTTMFEKIIVKTKKPVYAIEIYKINKVNNTLEYKVYLQSNYKISNVNVSLSFDGVDKNINDDVRRISLPTVTLPVSEGDKVLRGTFSIDPNRYSVINNSLFKLNVDSVTGDNGTIIINSYDTFRLVGDTNE